MIANSIQDILNNYPDDKLFDIGEIASILGVTRDTISARVGSRNIRDGYYIKYLIKANTGKRGNILQYFFPKSEVIAMAVAMKLTKVTGDVADKKTTKESDGLDSIKNMARRWVENKETVSHELIKRLGV